MRSPDRPKFIRRALLGASIIGGAVLPKVVRADENGQFPADADITTATIAAKPAIPEYVPAFPFTSEIGDLAKGWKLQSIGNLLLTTPEPEFVSSVYEPLLVPNGFALQVILFDSARQIPPEFNAGTRTSRVLAKGRGGFELAEPYSFQQGRLKIGNTEVSVFAPVTPLERQMLAEDGQLHTLQEIFSHTISSQSRAFLSIANPGLESDFSEPEEGQEPTKAQILGKSVRIVADALFSVVSVEPTK